MMGEYASTVHVKGVERELMILTTPLLTKVV